jgi:hypothetical protein
MTQRLGFADSPKRLERKLTDQAADLPQDLAGLLLPVQIVFPGFL